MCSTPGVAASAGAALLFWSGISFWLLRPMSQYTPCSPPWRPTLLCRFALASRNLT